jgi:hypothetical protein
VARFGEPGIVRVLIFTRSDCPIANRFAPELRRLGAEYSPLGVQFRMIYPDPRESIGSMKAHLRDYEIPFEGVLDPEHRLVDASNARVTPEAVVIDRSGQQIYRGRIDDRFTDFSRSRRVPTRHDLRDAIEACLSGRPVSVAVTPAIGCLISDLR